MDKDEAKDGIETLILLSFALISLIVGVVYAWHQEIEEWFGHRVGIFYVLVAGFLFLILTWNFFTIRAALRIENERVINQIIVRRPGKKSNKVKVEKGVEGKL